MIVRQHAAKVVVNCELSMVNRVSGKLCAQLVLVYKFE